MCEKCEREFGKFVRGAAVGGLAERRHAPPPPPRRPLHARTPSQLHRLIAEDGSIPPPRVAGRVVTESLALDAALGGGLPTGSLLLVRTQEGAGGVEFALTVLRTAVRRREARRVRFLTALRAPERARREAVALFEEEHPGEDIEFLPTSAPHAAGVDDLGAGDVAVIEDAASISGADPSVLDAAAREFGEVAARTGAVIILLESAGTLVPLAQARLEAHADIVCDFSWAGSPGPMRRRLTVRKLRGLGPMFESNAVPTFEVSFKRGVGFEAVGVTHIT